MKLAIFGIFMLVALALATPVPDPEGKAPEEPKDLEPSQADDLKADNTFGFVYHKPYYYSYRPYYRSWGGYGGYGGWGGYGGYGGWGGYGGYHQPYYNSYYNYW